ncbi:MAG: hypothetical protein CSA26_03020 [Desulfobacterales bacterium]|nr:MAG: hypothetical protein CSA26_03020 [Desulfobacterales bacterium]
MKNLSLGCDLGSSSVKLAVIDKDHNRLATRYSLHGGDAPCGVSWLYHPGYRTAVQRSTLSSAEPPAPSLIRRASTDGSHQSFD